ECAVLEDVDLDPGQDPERREVVVQRGDDVELPQKSLARKTVRDREPGGVVGERHVPVAECPRRSSHDVDLRAAVAPQRVDVEVAPESGQQVTPLTRGDGY